MSTRDITRLPVWAQDYIRGLERQLNEANDRMAEMNGEVGATDTRVTDSTHGDQALPKGSRIRFADPEDVSRGWIEARWSKDRLEISAERQLLVVPHVTNTLALIVAPRTF